MQQISYEKARQIALSDKKKVRYYVRYFEADWLKEQALNVADIECKRMNKTFFGEWPKGWKAEMKRWAMEATENHFVRRWIQDHCREIDGALWVASWQEICKLKHDKAE
jgi:hypothetical protein